MKLKYILLQAPVWLLLFCAPGRAQGDAPAGKVIYKQLLAAKADSGNAEKQYNEKDVALYFGKSSSIFQPVAGKGAIRIRTADGNEADSAMMKRAMAELEKRMPGLENRPRAGLLIYKEYDQPRYHLQQTYNGERYLIRDEAPAIQWQIAAGKKQIGGYNCTRATAVFRGRSYEAWFTPDIAVSAGPWKLGGLPGLILEAADTGKEVIFRFQAIQMPNPDAAITLLPPAEGQPVTMAEYQAVVNKHTEKLENMLKVAGGNANVSRKELVALEKTGGNR